MTSTAREAVVTGAAQGIGRHVAEVFAEEGYALALIDLREPRRHARSRAPAGYLGARRHR